LAPQDKVDRSRHLKGVQWFSKSSLAAKGSAERAICRGRLTERAAMSEKQQLAAAEKPGYFDKNFDSGR